MNLVPDAKDMQIVKKYLQHHSAHDFYIMEKKLNKKQFRASKHHIWYFALEERMHNFLVNEETKKYYKSISKVDNKKTPNTARERT